MPSVTMMTADLNDAPVLAPVGNYKLKIEDFLPKGTPNGGSPTADVLILNFAEPEDADRYMFFKHYLNEERPKPASLDDDAWAGICERNRKVDAAIYEAFGMTPETAPHKWSGKVTKTPLRVGTRNAGNFPVNTVILPANPAPQGSYKLEILSCEQKTKTEGTGMRGWLSLTIGFPGTEYSSINGLGGIVKTSWSRQFPARDASGKGFESAKQYLDLIRRDIEMTKRVFHAFGLLVPQAKQTDDLIYMDIPEDQTLRKGLVTSTALGIYPQTDKSGETTNAVRWPVLPFSAR